MADVAATLALWSNTTASNSPAGGTAVGTGLDDNLRELQGVVVRGLSHKGSDIASASTTDIGAVEGLMHDITGTTSIVNLGTVRAGIWKILKFEGALTLTHNSTSLILPGGANITTADGDIGIFISEGSGNWRCVSYFKATGKPIVQATLATLQASTSGTSIDFTSIPAWVKKITVMLVGVSTDGTSLPIIQIGDSGGVEATGYLGAGATAPNASATSGSNFTTGFGISAGVAARVMHGAVTLHLVDASTNTWVAYGVIGFSDFAAAGMVAGSKSLSGTLDRVRLTTVNGTDAFDAGSVNISYE